MSERRRAVSDTLGFVLVFGIVVSTVAVAYVGGFDALTGARDAQQFDNTERAFDVFDANVEDLAIRGAPSRTTEVMLSDGTLAFGDPVTFNVTTDSDYYATTVRPLVYRADDGSELVYSNGALFRQYGDRSVMFDEPRFAAGDRTFIPYLVTRAGSSDVSTDNSRRVLVRTTVSDREVKTFEDADADLVVTSPRAGAWEQYLEAELDVDCTSPDDGTDEEVRCPLEADDVYVQAIVVDAAFN